MLRSPSRAVWLASAAAWALSACALEPGQPWGWWSAEVRARASVAADRQLPDGRFRTASEYVWQLDPLQLELDSLRLVVTDNGASIGFDPAKPPAGYSLCHGGHCHANDGRLVDYAEVQTELLGKTQGNTAIDLPLLATITMAQADVAAQQTGTAAMPLGNVASLQLSWRGLRLHGKVWDARPGSPRLPADGVALTLLLPADSVSVLLDGHTGPHQPLRWHTAIDLDLPASWLDSFDPAPLAKDATALDLPPDHPAVQVLNEALHGHVRASVSVGHPPQ